MSEEKGSARPRQVTMAVVMAVVSSTLLILSLFETLERLRTPATREAVGEFLAGAPGSSLNLNTDQVVEVMRALAFVSGALAAAALVFAIYVWQRHRGARVGFTVAAVLLLLTVPVAGLMPVFLVVAAFLIWSPPARDWYAGRAVASAGAGDRRSSPVVTPVDRQESTPHHLAQPSAPAESAPPPPYAQPYGQSYEQPMQQRRPTGSHLHPGQVADKRPTTVTVAAVLTWIGGGLTALAMVAFLVVLAVNADAFIDEFNRAARRSELTLSRDQTWAFGLGIGVTMLMWSLIAIVLAVFAYRRSNGARYALAISAVMAALFSLVSIMSIVSAFTLLLAVATVVLLFTSSANRWFSRRSSSDGQPPYPPHYPPSYGQPVYGPPDQPAYPPADQPAYPPADQPPPKRNQPW